MIQLPKTKSSSIKHKRLIRLHLSRNNIISFKLSENRRNLHTYRFTWSAYEWGYAHNTEFRLFPLFIVYGANLYAIIGILIKLHAQWFRITCGFNLTTRSDCPRDKWRNSLQHEHNKRISCLNRAIFHLSSHSPATFLLSSNCDCKGAYNICFLNILLHLLLGKNGGRNIT